MIRLLILLPLIMMFSQCKAQTIYDIEKPYQGVIVKQDVEVYDNAKKTWFIPTLEEVKKAEILLENNIKVLNKEKLNQEGNCPIIDKNLSKYLRQYIGYVTKSGDKVILFNMLWPRETEYQDLETEFAVIFDGCSRYWKVKVNLDEQEVYDLRINGSA